MTPKLVIVDASQLRDELLAMGFSSVYGPRDARVALPHLEWIQQFLAFLKTTNPQYAAGCWDCDDFAFDAVTKASEALRQAGQPNCGHSFLYCQVDMFEGEELNGITGAHATNLVKTADGLWRFAEPQNGKITNAPEAIANIIGSLDFCIL